MDMHSRFAVFDPLTIDDRLLKFLYKKWESIEPRPPKIVVHRSVDRWPEHSETFNLPLLTQGVEYPEIIDGLDPNDVREFSDEVDYLIRWLDLRLVDQSECLGAYRPNYENKPARGVLTEIDYANNSGVHVCVYNPGEDGAIRYLYSSLTNTSDYTEFLRLLEQLQVQLRKDKTKKELDTDPEQGYNKLQFFKKEVTK